MDNDISPESFAKQKRAVVVAPAGYGKTELIARSVVCSEGRQLILTHTHAGVDSILKRIKEKYPVSSSHYYIETIHSFALRFSGSYPKITGLTIQQPRVADDYNVVISSAIEFFGTKIGKDILKASYSGIFVDEYQDCGIDQHELICKLAEIIPCRVVGDPLQAIFDFGSNNVVDWEGQVEAFFEPLSKLTVPYRWIKTKPELAESLMKVRNKLESNHSIEFSSVIPSDSRRITNFLKYENFRDQRVFTICEPTNTNYPHYLAKNLGNKFRTIEPFTSEKLCEYAQEIEGVNGEQRVSNVIHFCVDCLTNISTACNRAMNPGRKILNEKEIELVNIFGAIIQELSLKPVYSLFRFLENEFNPTYKRYQLWQEMKKGLCEVLKGGAESLEEAVWIIRSQSRFKKNRIPRRCISRTVLLKGLECDHAIIIKPELFDKKNLYVALTRASSKVTIISNCKTWSNY